MNFEADEPRSSHPANGGCGREYILDMIGQLAGLARQSGDHEIAIHLEAILSAARARRRR